MYYFPVSKSKVKSSVKKLRAKEKVLKSEVEHKKVAALKEQIKATHAERDKLKAKLRSKSHETAVLGASKAGCNVSDEEAIALYQAIPFAFSSVPILSDSGTADAKVVRGTARSKVTGTYTVEPGTFYALSPCPLTMQNGAGQHTAWAGYKSLAPVDTSTMTVPFLTQSGVEAYAPTSAQFDQATYSIISQEFTVSPDTAGGVEYGPTSLCGGFFCTKVMLPYNGLATVWNFGPSDASNVQGIGTGDGWRYLTSIGSSTPQNWNTTVVPRRQFTNSAIFHGKNASGLMSDVLGAVEPVMLMGSSNQANMNFGYCLVNDPLFNPISPLNTGIVPGSFIAADFYPPDNPMSGPLQGQGITYIHNNGEVPISLVVEMYVDYCVAIGPSAQVYTSMDTLTYGTDGAMPPSQRGVQFPGYNSTNCEELIFKCALERIPKLHRNDRVADCLKKLVSIYAKQANQIQSKTMKLIPMTTSPKKSFMDTVGGYFKSGAKWLSDHASDIVGVGKGVYQVVRGVASVL